MNSSKFVLQSTGVWGGILSLLSFVIVLLTSPHASAADKYFAINGMLWSIVAIRGRIKAKHKLHFKKGSDDEKKK